MLKKQAMQDAPSTLAQAIDDFRAQYEPALAQLASLLDASNISHYSSGCNDKRLTYDIFPASDYVRELLGMLSLERGYKPRMYNGYRDSTGQNEYNPAVDFMHYLRRWSGFAEQAMRTEGASARGTTAARAKLMMDELFLALSEGKSGATMRTTHFARLMIEIGRALELATRQNSEQEKLKAAEEARKNYLAALSAVQSTSMGSVL
jgi:hypothetical protein